MADLIALLEQAKQYEEQENYAKLAEIYRQIATYYHDVNDKENENEFLTELKEIEEILLENKLFEILDLPDDQNKINLLENLKNENRDYSYVYLGLAETYTVLNLFEKAKVNYEYYFNNFEEEDIEDFGDVYFNFGELLEDDYFKEYDLARKYYEKTIELNPNYDSAYNNLGLLLTNDYFKEYDLARKYYEKAIELAPNTVNTYYNFSILLANDYFKEYDLARKHYEKAFELNPNDEDICFNLAILLEDDYFKEYDLARKYYENAIEINPNYEDAYYNLGLLLRNDYFKEYDLARKYYENAIKLSPDSNSFYALANLLSDDYFKEYDLARKYYEKAIELNPNNEDIYLNLAILLENDYFKEFNLARKYYEKTIELKPSGIAFHILGDLFLNDYFKEYDLARKYYEKAIELNPDYDDVYNNLGLLLIFDYFIEYDLAKNIFEKGLNINDKNNYLHYNYADLLANHFNDKEKAKFHLKKAIELNKEDDISILSRVRLKKLAFEGDKSTFISKIEVNKILHLTNIKIEINKNELNHLLITGQNGCGKTVLMNQLRNFLQKIINSDADVAAMDNFETEIDLQNPHLLTFEPNARALYYKYHSGSYIIAHFEARRNLKLAGIKNLENIVLPTYSNIVNETGETHYLKEVFLKYAINKYAKAGIAALKKAERLLKKLNLWIENFEHIVKIIDPRIEKVVLETEPHYYFNFIPKAPYEKFTFEQLADGFESIFSIVAELILRMQNKTLTTYHLEGLVLIDEPEAHLHINLQKQILPKLLQIFPNIQFIVATHSPFVLSSISNAVIFDLEKKTRVEDFSGYAYDGLVETYFDSDKYSISIKKKLDEYISLVEKAELTEKEEDRLEDLEEYLDQIPDHAAIELKLKFQEYKIKNLNKQHE